MEKVWVVLWRLQVKLMDIKVIWALRGTNPYQFPMTTPPPHWNCKGTIARGFVTLIKDLQRVYKFPILYLLETHTSGETAKSIVAKCSFDGFFHSGCHWAFKGDLGAR